MSIVEVVQSENKLIENSTMATPSGSDINQPVSDSSEKSHSERIPVSEIIVSAHICLLIHAILYTRSEVNEGGRNGVYSSRKDDFLRYLPRQSFWLPTRILKAFLSLQEKTDVLVLDSMSPVLDVIAVMTKMDEV